MAVLKICPPVSALSSFLRPSRSSHFLWLWQVNNQDCLLATATENGYSLKASGNSKGQLLVEGTSILPPWISVYKSEREQHSLTTMMDQAKIRWKPVYSNTHWHQHFHGRTTSYLAVLHRCTDLSKLKAAGYLKAGGDQKLWILLLRPYLVHTCLLTTYMT